MSHCLDAANKFLAGSIQIVKRSFFPKQTRDSDIFTTEIIPFFGFSGEGLGIVFVRLWREAISTIRYPRLAMWVAG